MRKVAAWMVAAGMAGFACIGATTHLAFDNRAGTRVAGTTERIAFSPAWATTASGASATVSLNGEVVTNASQSGFFVWTPRLDGTYTFAHAVTRGGMSVGGTLHATFSVVGTLGSALDTVSLTFQHGGAVPWTGQTAVSHDGINAARSGRIAHGQKSSFQTTVTGTGVVTFWWRVSSEERSDKLRFYVDGIDAVPAISGEVGWTQVSLAVSSGPHVLTWSYEKDAVGSRGGDCGWVDQVVWAPTYAVTFDADGGSCPVSSMTATNGMTYGSLPMPTRTGYTFAGWYTSASGDGSLVTGETTVALAGAQTLHARWDPIELKGDPVDGHANHIYAEGEEASIHAVFSPAFSLAPEAYVFLEPQTPISASLASSDCFTRGVRIRNGEARTSEPLRLKFLDGTAMTAEQGLQYKLKIRTAEIFEDGHEIAGYASPDYSVFVTNALPRVDTVYMGARTPEYDYETGRLVMWSSATVGVPTVFTYRPADGEVAADLTNDTFTARWTFYDGWGYTTNVVGSPSGVSVSYRFVQTGRARVTVELRDKDMPEYSFGPRYEFFVDVEERPWIELTPAGYSQTFSESQSSWFYVRLTKMPSSTVKVRLEVTRTGADNGNYPIPALSAYELDFDRGMTEKVVYLKGLDGTSAGANSGYRIRARVVTESTNWDGVRYCDLYGPGAMSLYVVNTAPEILLPSPADANVYTTMLAQEQLVRWQVRDVSTNDVASGLTVTIMNSEGASTVFKTTALSGVFTNRFTAAGEGKWVGMQVRDKDGGVSVVTRRRYSVLSDIDGAALGVTGLPFGTSSEAAFFRTDDATAPGGTAMRSGGIRHSTQSGTYTRSVLATTVQGPGTVAFAWRSSCESGSYTYDHAEFAVDGVVAERINGITDWRSVVRAVTGSGPHVVTWTYLKDDEVSAGEDCVWVGGFSWTPECYAVRFNANGGSGTMPDAPFPLEVSGSLPTNAFTRTGYTFAGWATSPSGAVVYSDGQTVSSLASTSGATVDLYAQWTETTHTSTTSVAVPYAWIRTYFPGTADCEAKVRERAANARHTVENCYVAGLDPRDATAEFRACVTVRDGQVRISWMPNLNTGAVTRVYAVWGRTDLATGSWERPARPWHRFFKVTVAMPTGADGEETAVAGEGFVPQPVSRGAPLR